MAEPMRSLASKLNWLRAGVLGANDGIVSVAGLVMGVAGATQNSAALFIAGLAGLVAGALSMAGGEYVSVSTQKDTELAAVQKVRELLEADPEKAMADLSAVYENQGCTRELANQVARTLNDHDAIATHTQAQYGISAHEQTSPWIAAFASFIAFTMGALIPLIAMVCASVSVRVISTSVAVMVALALTGSISAWLGGANISRAVLRNCLVGALTMGITYLVGNMVGIHI
ncbi:MAG: VIT family protein [Propionibacteriaceae bacterium]|nr:VIT family protein [Propionibacteriaceae bacterium]